MCFWIEDIASVVMNELYLFDVIVETTSKPWPESILSATRSINLG